MARLKISLALLGALALAACGVKGPLEPPPGAPQAAKPASPPPAAAAAAGTPSTYRPPQSSAELANSATPHADWEKPKTPQGAKPDPLQGIPRPDQPFVLDGLL